MIETKFTKNTLRARIAKDRFNYLVRINNIKVKAKVDQADIICNIYNIDKPKDKNIKYWIKNTFSDINKIQSIDFSGMPVLNRTPTIVKKSQIDFYDSLKWKALRKNIIKVYGVRCMKCNISNVEMHVDHIKPRSLYPELELEESNLQVLCKFCNLEKSNKNEIDYRPEGRFYSNEEIKNLKAEYFKKGLEQHLKEIKIK